jgi:hypothetical protein
MNVIGPMGADRHAGGFQFTNLVPGHEGRTAIVDRVGRYEQRERQSGFFQSRPGHVVGGTVGVVDADRDRPVGQRHAVEQGRDDLVGPDYVVPPAGKHFDL